MPAPVRVQRRHPRRGGQSDVCDAQEHPQDVYRECGLAHAGGGVHVRRISRGCTEHQGDQGDCVGSTARIESPRRVAGHAAGARVYAQGPRAAGLDQDVGCRRAASAAAGCGGACTHHGCASRVGCVDDLHHVCLYARLGLALCAQPERRRVRVGTQGERRGCGECRRIPSGHDGRQDAAAAVGPHPGYHARAHGPRVELRPQLERPVDEQRQVRLGARQARRILGRAAQAAHLPLVHQRAGCSRRRGRLAGRLCLSRPFFTLGENLREA
ncbi:hypothetical protein L1887_49503 [Cichorium endivia]|nr:hypothetical protein L1887_49503 [Cichorium endivia]